MVAKTARRVFCERWKEIAVQLRNGSYFVKRGAINWTTFPFDTYERAIAIMLDDGQLLRTQRSHGMKPTRCSMEIFCRLPSDQEVPEIDDGLMDELLDDAESVVRDLLRSKDSSGDPVVFRIDENTARFVEAHDVQVKVQGVVVMFNLEY